MKSSLSILVKGFVSLDSLVSFVSSDSLSSFVSLVFLFDLPLQHNRINSSTLHGAAVALSRRARCAWESAPVVLQRLRPAFVLVLSLVDPLNAALKTGPELYKQ